VVRYFRRNPEQRDRSVDKMFLDGVAAAGCDPNHDVVISDGKSAASKSRMKKSVAAIVSGVVRSMAVGLKPDDVCRLIQDSAGQSLGNVHSIAEVGYATSQTSTRDDDTTSCETLKLAPMSQVEESEGSSRAGRFP